MSAIRRLVHENDGRTTRWRATVVLKDCTYCGEPLRVHACDCCSCNQHGAREAWRCGTTCYTVSDRYKRRKEYGDAAATAWASHRNHGGFCSEKCHDADAARARKEATKLETKYQWIKEQRSLLAAAEAARPTKTRTRKRTPPASSSPAGESPHRKTFAI